MIKPIRLALVGVAAAGALTAGLLWATAGPGLPTPGSGYWYLTGGGASVQGNTHYYLAIVHLDKGDNWIKFQWPRCPRYALTYEDNTKDGAGQWDAVGPGPSPYFTLLPSADPSTGSREPLYSAQSICTQLAGVDLYKDGRGRVRGEWSDLAPAGKLIPMGG